MNKNKQKPVLSFEWKKKNAYEFKLILRSGERNDVCQYHL